MTRQQFRLLVIANQLLLFAAYVVRDLTDVYLPPELQGYLAAGGSVMDNSGAGVIFTEQNVYALWVVIDLAALVAAVGLCLGRRWGRTLFLASFIVSLFASLFNPVHVSAGWADTLFVLFGATEGMILALAYFSHLRRMFARKALYEEARPD